MAWTLIATGEAELTLAKNGGVEWNAALQGMLGDPEWVDLLWEPAERWLGVRCNYVTDGWPVYSELDNGEFKVDSGDALDEAGVSVDENYSAVPVKTAEPVLGPDGALYNPEPVWYITVPEE